MKNQTNTNRLLSSSFAIALTLAIWLPTTATAADEPMMPMKGEHQMMDGKMMMGTNTVNHTNMMHGTVGGNMMNQTNMMHGAVGGNMMNQTNMMKHANMTNRIDGGNMTIHTNMMDPTNMVNKTSGKP